MSTFYLMKDVSRLSGHSIHTLKFYLKLGLIKEAGRSPQTRFRYFNEATLAELSAIRAWRKTGKKLSEIQPLLAVDGSQQERVPPTSNLQPPAVGAS